jgi:hypothetical protein
MKNWHLDGECENCLEWEDENGESQIPVVGILLQLNNPKLRTLFRSRVRFSPKVEEKQCQYCPTVDEKHNDYFSTIADDHNGQSSPIVDDKQCQYFTIVDEKHKGHFSTIADDDG